MFTGLVEATGTVANVSRRAIEIETPVKIARSMKKGSSLCVQGVCLTLVSKDAGGAHCAPLLRFELLRETLKRSTLGGLKKGQPVNLERPLKWRGRLEGHLVQGHVEGVGRVEKIIQKGREKSARVSFPAPFAARIFEKGSIAVDGVSLTVGKVGKRSFWAHLVPHTLKITSLSRLERGSRVNLETDTTPLFYSHFRVNFTQ